MVPTMNRAAETPFPMFAHRFEDAGMGYRENTEAGLQVLGEGQVNCGGEEVGE